MPVELRRLSMEDAPYIGEYEVVRKRLESDGLSGKELLYRVFSANNVMKLVATGQDIPGLDFITCMTEQEIKEPFLNHKPFYKGGRRPALAIFDASQMENIYHGVHDSKYRFKNPEKKMDALLAVYRLVFA